MKLFGPDARVDDFVIDGVIHSGGMAHIYSVHHADPALQPDFPMVLKMPRMTAGDGAENLVGFEVERQILSVLKGLSVPHFVAAGDVATQPYIVMEYVKGRTLQQWLDETLERRLEDIVRIGAALARAVHRLHRQEVCHLDLKPANVLLKEGGGIVLLDFGLSCHAHYPDLLAEELRKAVGSPTWIAPEQVVGVRGDPRSDVFAIGVMLYEMCTGELPFGNPQTDAGMRQRLWMHPRPPRAINRELPEWMQEIIMRCLEPHADDRYASGAHLAFDLTHPEHVKVTARGRETRGLGFWAHFKRWISAAGMQYQPSALPTQQIAKVPIVMVAVAHADVTEATLQTLRVAVGRALGDRPGARLACVTVISPNETSTTDDQHSEIAVHQQMLGHLRHWAKTLELGDHQASFHVLESSDVAQAILAYAEGNHVNMIIMGAATHGLNMQRFVATVPIKVAMNAPCTVMLVKGS
jgi:nucleotide-binding universal stress UspA family protein/predicted Ser/Thr protein kinase